MSEAGQQAGGSPVGTARGQVARVSTVAFQGIEVVDVDVQVTTGGGLPSFQVVGLADKAVGESRERVRSALAALGWRCRPSGSRSTWPRPTCRRKAAISICRSRLRS